MVRFSKTQILQERFLLKLAQSISPDTVCWLSSTDGLTIASRAAQGYIWPPENSEVPPYITTPVAVSVAQQLSKHLPLGEIFEAGFMYDIGHIFARPVGDHLILSVVTDADVQWETIVDQMEIFTLELLEYLPISHYFYRF